MKHFTTKILLTMLVSMIGLYASAHDIEVKNADGVTIYYSFNKDKTGVIVSYKGNKYDSYSNEYSGNVSIPESVSYEGNNYHVISIGEGAFEGCIGLTSVTIPNSVTSIGEYAFLGCRGLKSVTIGSGVTSIGGSAFYNCTGLKSVTIGSGVKSIGGSAFYGCKGLTSVTIGSGMELIGDNAFYGCTGLTSVDIPNNVTSIGGCAFYNCTGLKSVTIGSGVTSIGGSAFYSCTGLTSVTIGSGMELIGDNAFYGCTGLTSVDIPNNVTSIGGCAFYNCTGLKSVTIGSGVTSIGGSAFYGCKGLTSVTIGSGMELIGDNAFYGCTGLTSVDIPNNVTSIGGCAFYNCTGLKSVTIGSGVTSIGGGAFYKTILRKTIWLTNTLPSGYEYAVGSINYVSNEQLGIDNQVVFKFLSSYFDVDGIRYVPVSPSDKICDAIDCVYNESAENTKIPSTVDYKGVTMKVRHVRPYMAYGNKYIKNVIVDNEGSVYHSVFRGCSNLKNISFGPNIALIGSHLFYGCSLIEEIDIPSKAEILYNYTFYGCTSLKSIKIKSKMKEIRDNAFLNCTSLKNVIIENSDLELTLGSNTFYDDSNKKPLFSDCPLDSVYIGRNINYSTDADKGYSPFYRNTSLRAVKITDKETEISENEFYGCTNLQSVTIGDGVTTIGNRAFSGCSSLKHFTFGSHVQTIGSEAFSDCAAVTEISSRASTPPACGKQALDDINKWECKLYVPKGCLPQYQAADQWKDFFFIEEGEMSPNPEEPQTNKCKTPTIEYHNGMLKFNCETDGAICQSTITDSDIKSYSANEVQLGVTYTITVYATKAGYENSETATATLCWIDVEPKTEGITNSVASVRANAVLIQSSGSMLTISGAEEGTTISVYDTAGREVGSAKVSSDITTIETSLHSGQIGIIKIGEKAVKVMMK